MSKGLTRERLQRLFHKREINTTNKKHLSNYMELTLLVLHDTTYMDLAARDSAMDDTHHMLDQMTTRFSSL